MLKTNSKKTRENVRAYILDGFTPENYDRSPLDFKTFEEVAAFILDCFRSEKYSCKEDYRYYNGLERVAFADWCAGLPSILDTCYYYNRSAVDDLGAILEETEAEKAKYTESDAQARLTWLIYRELTAATKK